MFHKENAKHPMLSSTSKSSTHLGCRCIISRKEAIDCGGVLHTCLDAGVFQSECIHIYTVHIVFVYGVCAHVSMCITKWVPAVLRVEGERVTGVTSQESTQSTIERWIFFGKVWRLNIYEKRSWFRSVEDKQTDADVLTTTQAGGKAGGEMRINI